MKVAVLIPCYNEEITIGKLFKNEVIAGVPVIVEFMETHFITRLPSAVLAYGLGIVAILFFTCGLILDNIAKNNALKYELYLNCYCR